jgi:hypothetical protein
MNERRPLPTGLIGTAGPVTLDYAAGKPFFPFLSLAQIVMILAIYSIGMGIFALFIRRAALPFTAAGAFVGMLPSIWGGIPCQVVVRTPRPEPWADFTRQWAAACSYRQEDDDPNMWLPEMPIWRRWPGASIQLRILENALEVRGGRHQMRQLKRNFDRITARGHRWTQ